MLLFPDFTFHFVTWAVVAEFVPRVPVGWLNPILLGLAAISLVAGLILGVAAIFRGKAQRPKLLWGALACGASSMAFVLAIYGLFFWVQVPSLSRQMEEAVREAARRRAEQTSIVQPGTSAPPFELLQLEGEVFSLAEEHGKVVLLNFFATWCGPCLMELPYLQALWHRYKEHPQFKMLVIARGQSPEEVREFLKQNGYSFPVAADSDQSVFYLYAKQLIPRTYLIDQSGTVVRAIVGYYLDELKELEKYLAELLAEPSGE